MENIESSISPEPTIDAIRASADVAFNATVTSLGAAPGYPSGYVTAYQGVTASVTELRSGQGLQVGDQIDLAVPVVGSSSYTVAGPRGVPALDPAVFRSGAPFAAWAKWAGDRWTAILVEIEPAPQVYTGGGRARFASDRKAAGI